MSKANNKMIVLSQKTDTGDTKEVPKLVARRRAQKHLANVKQILKFTNATPIKSHTGIGYGCCYCKDQFPEPSQLKSHTIQTHPNLAEAGFPKIKLTEYRLKLDITHLKCNICNKEINSLEDLFNHLVKQHDKTVHTDIPNHIVPFKFDTDVLTCFLCSNVFNTFKMLLSHMHSHYRNYVCDICDAGFVNQFGMTNHRTCHLAGTFTCQHCPKVFNKECYKKAHERVVHLLANMTHKCPYCTEKFYSSHFKYVHIANVHGVKKGNNFKCNACEKVFNSFCRLKVHTRRDHLMERKHRCVECEKTFYSSTMLAEHMVCHTGAKKYECEVCTKRYARKKTLVEHMRIHNDDRRFACEHCGQAFVQKCSWRGHMRSKHGEDV